MRSAKPLRSFAAPTALLLCLSAPAPAAVPGRCGGDFETWLEAAKAEARAAGISADGVAELGRIGIDPKVLRLDRSQHVFTQDWLTFAGRMVNAYRLRVGKEQLAQWAETFAGAQERFGVPSPVIAAFWGLETDYGAVQGDFDTLSALATLAHDCRRPELFRPQLIDALRLIDLGWLGRSELRGAWAGELGQVQLLPSDYLSFGVDGDGDGEVRLRDSKADVILTAARYLAHLGWQAGLPWLEEVRVPDDLPWAHAGAYRRYPREQWSALGVRRADGSELDADALPAALLLPMGRKGPAFLAYPNFDVFLAWNQSLVYATTAAYFATRLAGAPEVSAGQPEPGLNAGQMEQLQHLLVDRGHDVGAIDGVLGAKTRAAVRAEQSRLGMPADAWPTPELLSRLREAGSTDPGSPMPH
jgi:lytic murein transglycosylase